MRDLVEHVIDGILQQEKAQQLKPAPDAQAGAKFRNVLAAATPAAAQPSSLQQNGPVKEKDEALWKVSLQFESIFVQQMMSEMRKSVGKSDFMPSGFAEDVHASMMDEAIAKVSTRRSSFGIAESIYRQLEASKAGPRQTVSAQEISNTADKLKMANDLTTEASKHAY